MEAHARRPAIARIVHGFALGVFLALIALATFGFGRGRERDRKLDTPHRKAGAAALSAPQKIAA